MSNRLCKRERGVGPSRDAAGGRRRGNDTSRGVLALVLGCVLAGALLTAGPASAASRGFVARTPSRTPITLAAVAKPAARPAVRTALVPVWVFLDGDTPVTGGRVRVYAGGLHANRAMAPVRARALRQRDGARQERSSAMGVALLEFARLPRTFTVVVSGGRAGGERLSGSLSVHVRGYRFDVGNVVSVDPVTTLVDSWQRVHPRVSTRRARRTVDRALGLPAWADDIDLRATDRWFDGDAFLRASSRGTHAVAQINRETGGLLMSIRRGGRTRHFYARHPRAAQASPPVNDAGGTIAQWWKDLDIQKLVTDGMSDLGLSVVKWGAQEGGKWLLGHLLDAWGLKSVKDFLLPKSDTQVIIAMMNALNKKVTELQATVESTKQAVAETQFSTLVAQTDGEAASINKLSTELTFIASLKADDPLRIEASKNLVVDIGKQLADPDVGGKLNQALAKPVGNTILKAASQVYGTQRFFTNRSSQAIKAIYDYYAVMQLNLANLLTEYWSTTPKRNDDKTCSAACVKRTIVDQINSDIQAQKTQLKPDLPSNKFIDTRTMKMWDSRPPWVNGGLYAPAETGPKCPPRCFPVRTLGPPPGAILGNEDDFRQLIENWKGANPLEYLQREAGLVVSAPAGTPTSWLGHMWLGPAPVDPIGDCRSLSCYQTITRINLSETDRPGPHVFSNYLKQFDPQAYYASAMTALPVEPGTYWWPFGGK